MANSRKKVTLKDKLKKVEWSKKFCAAIALAFGVYGIWCGIEYYRLCKIAIEYCSVMPDVTLAVVSVSTVIASLVSYLLYQAGLKNSRNKYGIDSEGHPFKLKVEDIEEQLEENDAPINSEEPVG